MRQPDGITVGSMETDDTDQAMTDPIADLFPNTTVLFADLAGKPSLVDDSCFSGFDANTSVFRIHGMEFRARAGASLRTA
jgi:hypothetical protein